MVYNNSMTTHLTTTLYSSSATLVSPLGIHSGVDITIQNLDSEAYVYIGGEGVTTSNFGYRVAPDTAVSFELPGKDALYAVTSSNGSQVAILKTGLEVGS
jgi:hypothetical protein